MSTTTCPRHRFPFADRPGVPMDPEYLERLRSDPRVPVTLTDGREALLLSGHADIRAVLADSRFSRAALGTATLFARDSNSLALAKSDPPLHTRRRAAVQRRFVSRRAELDRPWIASLAAELIEEVARQGPPADLVTAYLQPFTYGVSAAILGIPATDLDELTGHAEVLMSAGRYGPEAIAASTSFLHDYFAAELERRRSGGPGPGRDPDLLTELATAAEEDRLSDEEIVVFGYGLLMAGGETTANHLALSLIHVLGDRDLRATLVARPDAIGPVVEELLRWTWFSGTGGHPHLALEDVELPSGPVSAGTVVLPVNDAGNRDRSAFDDPDRFRPGREDGRHLAFGHGRHTCPGRWHARIELEVGIATALARLDGLALAVDPEDIDWRTGMFIRGVWSLPVTWRGA
jgi:cytochrome P450